MDELIKVNYADNTTMARDVYDFIFKDVEKKQPFRMWIARAITKYNFIEGKDFSTYSCETKNGRPKIDYVVTIDMGKELAMVSATKQGSIVRKYFLKCEEIAKEKAITRAIGKETRKTLTDAIEESGENERMHGRGYSNFTRLVYSLTGLTAKYKKYKDHEKESKKTGKDYLLVSFRDSLLPDELKRVELAESLIKPMLEMEKEYSSIKLVLEPLFKVKEIK
jgi:phage anti-repressor protein